MTEQEKIFFETFNANNLYLDALRRDRTHKAHMMNTASMRGIWSSIVEKYSDQAHFIYELLQNADDAGATTARFILRADELIFAHNGSRHFSISDPDNEEVDTANGTLGDVNAITSAANSNKTVNDIGKFGVGFKAVFQYTRTPHIYDVDINFKIERYIVPIRLENNHPERADNETLFVFPFDNPNVEPERAEREIADKLFTLNLPTLFLKNLCRVNYQCGSTVGKYDKTISAHVVDGAITVEQIRAWQWNFGGDAKPEPPRDFWLFTRTERIDDYDADISVGFLTADNKLVPANYNAFCFFPTKEKTGLNFIIHAPFLLTDSREGIRATENFNRTLIQKLAELAAKSLVNLKNANLIDDSILDIIPCDPSAFTALDSREQISFRPFYDEIKRVMQTEEILPTAVPKKYVSSKNAYWATTSKLSQLFDDERLRMLTGNPKAAWVFTSVSERHVGGAAFNRYVKELVAKTFEDENFLPLIDGNFIERQTLRWLRELYLYLIDRGERMKRTRTLPIFLNQDKKAAAAFDANGRATLFLPSSGLEGYETVYRELLKDKDIVQCLDRFGIKAPSLKDEIYSKILPLYRAANADIDTRPHIRVFLQYYLEASALERERFVDDLKRYKFVCVRRLDGKIFRCLPADAYFYSSTLEEYFQGATKIYFVCLEDYEPFVPKRAQEDLKIFLRMVGVAFEAPRLKEVNITREEAQRLKLPRYNEQREMIWTENRIDGCQHMLCRIELTQDRSASLILWSILLKVFEHRFIRQRTPEKELIGQVQSQDVSRRRMRNREFPSTDIAALRNTPWLLDREGQFRAPSALDTSTLSKDYDRKSEDAERLIKFLGIKDLSNLTAEQRELIELGRLAQRAGLTKKELNEEIRRRQQPEPSINPPPSTSSSTSRAEPSSNRPTVNPIVEPPSNVDRDENFSPPPADYSKQIDALNRNYEKELKALNDKAELVARAEAAQKYSYEWFTTLLALEKLNADSGGSRAISISFSRVERELESRRTLILKYPNHYIPSSIEELTDIPLKLSSRGVKVAEPIIDAISIKSFTLRVKIKDIEKIAGVDLSSVDEAHIEAKSPDFLLDALIKSFNALALEPTFDMKKNLPSNIRFIFGPPGTGKTTYLAREVLIPMMRQRGSARILVLTPTNKAADVLVARIISTLDAEGDQSYRDWLIRFVSTNDEEIERRGVLRERIFDITRLDRSITVTTIARFPYDYFAMGDKRLHLQALDWDCIVIDEASMIGLADIVYPLYRKTPRQFIIAGDPFQIEPITNVTQWKDENIYSMIRLASFQNPTTTTHNYSVRLLTTQYRSIPTVGEIFSRFAYDGVLAHHRSASAQRRLNLGLSFRTLNLIKFPVSKYESIYRAKRLQGRTPYHIYSALFVFELVKFLARRLSTAHNKKISIGIISAYRAEADLINKLTASMKNFPLVDVQVGTIHGFQGDECDIIFVVLNPPPFISDSDDMFLNKINIINVAISRARDYLFVLMPDERTENVERLRLVERLERLIKSSGDCCEMQSNEIEKIIFGSPTFIEENAFSTAHQDVNIYGSIERRYEIRSEDTAVDIQLHEITSAARD